jgi:predicted transglutaminase-like cysteine proteinase
MRSRFLGYLAAATIFGLAWNTFGEASEQGLPRASWTPVGGEASIPYGWVDFCNRHAEECTLGKLKPIDVRLTWQSWKTLNEINDEVNSVVEPISNLDHWGTTLDHWDYPVDGKGDCKIYALFKRKLLIERGFPRQALLMTIVRDLNGEGHAVLTVKTDRGDFVLDNLSDRVRPWSATGYQFYKRQAQEDPNVWLSLGGVIGTEPTEAAANGR